jgi:hypothetical protein
MLKDNFKTNYILSVIIAFLVVLVSIFGILFKDNIYPTENLIQSFIPNDIINLTIGIPFLIISLWLIKRGKIIGLLCWPGAIFYFLYVYFPYLLGIPFNTLFLPYLIIFSLCIYTLIGIVASLDQNGIKEKISGKVPYKVSGFILIALSLIIILRQVALIINALNNNIDVSQQELAVWIDDFTIGVPAMLISGYSLFKNKPLGYATGAGLFIAYSLLSLGLLPFLAIQSYLANTEIDFFGIIILLIMASICLVPFGYFVKALNK